MSCVGARQEKQHSRPKNDDTHEALSTVLAAVVPECARVTDDCDSRSRSLSVHSRSVSLVTVKIEHGRLT